MAQDKKMDTLRERLNSFLQVIETMNPEQVELEDVDRLLEMLDDLEEQCIKLQETK